MSTVAAALALLPSLLPSLNAFLLTRIHFSVPPPSPLPSPSPSPQTSVCCIEVRNLKRHAGCSRGQKQRGSFVKPAMGSAHAALLCPSPLLLRTLITFVATQEKRNRFMDLKMSPHVGSCRRSEPATSCLI